MATGAADAPPPFWDPPSAGAAGAGGGRGAPWPPPEGVLARVLKLNAFGDDYEDLASAAARGAGGRSVVGLWPAFSYFNHSCLPASVHYVVGESMVVRAVQEIAAGERGRGRPSVRRGRLLHAISSGKRKAAALSLPAETRRPPSG